MSALRVARPRFVAGCAVAVLAGLVVADVPSATQGGRTIDAAVTTTVPPTVTTSPPPTTAPAASGSAAPTTVPASPSTVPGPTPRESRRVPTAVDIEKIRATSLPLRTMAITSGFAVVALAAIGFVYGRVRSRVPALAIPASTMTGATVGSPGPPDATSGHAVHGTLPPPAAIPLPPPPMAISVEDAVSDTVIFEPPPTHHPPSVIADPPADEPPTEEPPTEEPAEEDQPAEDEPAEEREEPADPQ
jgi:hypothetical protein